MDVFYIKSGDRAPGLGALLQYADGSAQNLSGCTVKFNMRKKGVTTPTINEATVTVVAAATGEVRYDWEAGTTDVAGTYEGEFAVTLVDTRTVTFPNDDYIPIEITGEIT